MLMRMTRSQLLAAPVTVVALALGLAGCGSGSGASSAKSLPTLQLAGTGAVAQVAGAPSRGTVAIGADGWRLVGTLPGGTPAARPIYTLGSGLAGQATAQRLATVLHAGTVRRNGLGWVVGPTGAPTLIIGSEDGQQWTYSAGGQQCFGPHLDQCAVSSPAIGAPGTATTVHRAHARACVHRTAHATTATPGCGLVPRPLAGLPTVARTRAVAAPILAALGLNTTTARVQRGVVRAPRIVGRHAANGFDTQVDVDANGLVTYASGWLGGARSGASYPLITAAAAFAELRAQPVPEIAIACAQPGGNRTLSGSVCPAFHHVVTGASLGLMLNHRTDGTALLVPAWLFRVRGSADPVPVIAVQQRYVAGPGAQPTNPAGTDHGGPPGSTGGSSGAGGGSAGSSGATTHVNAEGYRTEDGGRTLVLLNTAGICPEPAYTATAKESGSSVTVDVVKREGPPQSPGVACPELAKVFETRVTLSAPLGDRKVINHDGSTVPRSHN
jgi:hypothetical protein